MHVLFTVKGFYFHFRPKTAMKSQYCTYVLRDFCYPFIRLSATALIRTVTVIRSFTHIYRVFNLKTAPSRVQNLHVT